MIVRISCPGCGGHGKWAAVKEKCSYCGGKKKIKLTYHLKKIGHFDELKNVEDFQCVSETKTME